MGALVIEIEIGIEIEIEIELISKCWYDCKHNTKTEKRLQE